MSLNITFNYFTDVHLLPEDPRVPAGEEGRRQLRAPRVNNKLIYFVDDLNMPKLDAYDTAMPISHIRQHLGWGHWFDRAKLSPKVIHNTQYVACMNPTAGAFAINPRLQRLFMTLAVDFPAQDSLDDDLRHLPHRAPEALQRGLPGARHASSSRRRWRTTRRWWQSFRKTAVNFHYEFTVRHLTNVFQGSPLLHPGALQQRGRSSSKLWLHESERVYADRLVSHRGPGHVQQERCAEHRRQVSSRSPASRTYYARQITPSLSSSATLPVVSSEKIYNDIAEFSKLQKILEDTLAGVQRRPTPVMDLVLFEDAMKHICRISRIISNPGGHALPRRCWRFG